jgi:adenylate cyclase
MDSRRRRNAAFLAIGAIAAAIGIGAYATHVLGNVERESIDTRFSIRGSQPAPKDLVVVQVDAATFDRLGEQWPFPRSLHGKVIRRLTDAGARVIAYDVEFTEESTPAEDNALIRAVDDARNVVLATTEVDVNRPGHTNVFGGERVLKLIGARAGNTVIDPDPGGVYRRFPAAVQGLDGFAVAAAEQAGADPVDRDAFHDDGAWIDYAGPPGTIRTVSFSNVLRGEVDPGLFRDKVVVVGPSAPSLQDVKPTAAGGGPMSGAEIQANAIASLLDGLPLRSAPGGVDIVLIVLLGVIAPAAAMRLRPIATFAIATAAAGLYLVAAQLTFDAGVIVPVAYPLMALAVGVVGTLGLHYVLAAFERQRVRDTFARFVPANVVDQVLAQTDDHLRLGGVRRDCTVLFSDIRGFTTYSEARPPDEVVTVLNHYLGEMTDAIMNHGGTLVAYMGDGIMAVFGAPIEQPDHADRAIAASREMLDVRLPAFCDWMRAAGYGEGFQMGIGLNSGEVMSGQVGSRRRMEYTTIGDTTNTAARLEGMTKGSGHQLFVADSTRRALVAEVPDLALVGDLPVRGREHEIRVWSLAAHEPEQDKAHKATTRPAVRA